MVKGGNERLLYEILNDAYPNEWVNEHRGIVGRKFRFDCANPEKKIAVEIEGGIWLGKGHTGGIHYQQDMTKYNLAVLEGWKVLRYSPETLRNNPGIIISHVRQLCGYETSQQTLNLDGCKQATLGQMQVHIS